MPNPASYKTILTVLRDIDEAKRVLPIAIEVAESQNGHLVTVHSEPAFAQGAVPDGYVGTDLMAREIEDAEVRVETLDKYIDETCGRAGVSFERHDAIFNVGGTSGIAIPAALTADLIIAGQPDGNTGTGTDHELEQLLFKSGRPVLIVPTAYNKKIDLKRVVVAWNASKEAARATFDALPILLRANSVELLIVDPKATADQDAEAAGLEMAAALARHGIDVTVKVVMSGGIPVGETIENRLADTGSGIVVMGAYSHSRWREKIFGGVTKTLIGSTPALTLMAH